MSREIFHPTKDFFDRMKDTIFQWSAITGKIALNAIQTGWEIFHQFLA
jgi:hypothetical protein